MRIGTWNLAGRWSAAHLDLLLALECDILLLTEVSERLDVPAYDVHVGEARMAPRRRWAGVLSGVGLDPLPDPHPGSAAARVSGLVVCSSVLPWKGCGGGLPWGAGNHAARTRRTVDVLLEVLPRDDLIWGGDFNHALTGREYAGSKAGRTAVLEAFEVLGLDPATTDLPHQIETLLSIDHLSSLPIGRCGARSASAR